MICQSSFLLKPTGRISAVPLDARFTSIWNNYLIQHSSFWTHKKITFKEDIKTFPKLPKDIQNSILKVLGYFAASDEIVEDMIKDSPIARIQIPEIQYCYNFEAMMENIHSSVYNLTIAAYVEDSNERSKVFRSVENMPSVAAKAEWAKQWIAPDSEKTLDHYLIGKACVEGINFSASFAFIDWLKTQKYSLNGLYEGNDEISRDEHRHCTTSVLIHNMLDDKLSAEEAKKIIDGSIEVEIEFIKDIIPSRGYLNMNQNMMIEHVKHCAFLLATTLGYPDMYKNTYCPFSFMNLRNFDSKVNMFEKSASEYAMADNENIDYDLILKDDSLI